MALYIEGENALVARLTTEFGITDAQARTAMNVAWMSLACGDKPLDVPGLKFEQCGEFLWVLEDGLMIATLEFEPGVLPRKVVPFQEVADRMAEDDGGWDAFWDHMEDLDRIALRAA